MSKWERDVALPDIATIPKLAELLGVSVEELLQAKVSQPPAVRESGRIVNSILKVVPLTMGVMVPVAVMLDILDVKIGFCIFSVPEPATTWLWCSLNVELLRRFGWWLMPCSAGASPFTKVQATDCGTVKKLPVG